MAQFFYEDFENGAADGTSLSSANTDFDAVTGTGGTAVVDTDQVAVGTRSALFTQGGGLRYMEYNGGAGNKATVWITFYLRIATRPSTGSINIAVIYSGASMVCEVRLSTAGVLVLRDKTFTIRVTGPTLTNDQWYRIAIRLTPTDGNTGMQMKTYTGANLHGSTSDTNTTSSTVTWDGLTTTDEINFGICSGSDTSIVFNVDDIHYDDASEWFPDVTTVTPAAVAASTAIPSWVSNVDIAIGGVSKQGIWT